MTEEESACCNLTNITAREALLSTDLLVFKFAGLLVCLFANWLAGQLEVKDGWLEEIYLLFCFVSKQVFT